MKKITFYISTLVLITTCILQKPSYAQLNATGGFHVLSICSDSAVRAWGDNSNGQIGDGTTTNKNTPVQVSGLTEVTKIAGGYRHSFALKNGGASLWAWGWNSNGQLGDGTTTDRATPVQITGLNGITSVSGGFQHSLLLKNDNTVWSWGANNNGQLGDGTTTGSNTPALISSLSGITYVSAGSQHSLALKNDGTVWAWGGNWAGQLGNGSTTNSSTPVQVTGLSGITAIAAADGHSLALKNDGTVWSWGENSAGQLGNGTTTSSSTPAAVSALTGIISVTGGEGHSMALKNDSTVWSWGNNLNGQLGNGTTTFSSTPVQVSTLTGINFISGGRYFSLAQKSDGTVWTWGQNASGQLGNGATTNSNVPVLVTGICPATSSVNEMKEPFKVSIYPNPFSEQTTIQFTNQNDFSKSELSIYDLQGRKVRQTEITTPSNFKIPRGNLENGIYLFQIKNERQIITNGKFIIQ